METIKILQNNLFDSVFHIDQDIVNSSSFSLLITTDNTYDSYIRLVSEPYITSVYNCKFESNDGNTYETRIVRKINMPVGESLSVSNYYESSIMLFVGDECVIIDKLGSISATFSLMFVNYAIEYIILVFTNDKVIDNSGVVTVYSGDKEYFKCIIE